MEEADTDRPDHDPTDPADGKSAVAPAGRPRSSGALIAALQQHPALVESFGKSWSTELLKQRSALLDSITKIWTQDLLKRRSALFDSPVKTWMKPNSALLDSVAKPWTKQNSALLDSVAKTLPGDLLKQNSVFLDSITKTWTTALLKERTRFESAITREVSRILERQQSQLRAVVERAAEFARVSFPPNIRDVEDLKFSEVEAVVMDDGIPLHGVPRLSIARSLIRAKDRAARRAILGRRWQEIVADCEAYLETATVREFDAERTFARQAVAALNDGHSAAAQALAANLLDTMVRKYFGADRVVLVPSKNVHTPDGYDDFVARKYWAVAPIWSAYRRFSPSNGDPVPREFARHASAHRVCPEQFSRRNAVQAVMLVSSLLGYLDEELSATWH